MAFDPKFYNERPGLLEIGGTIYTTWGSHCDQGPYTSWVMSFSADTLKQTSVLNLVPNGNEGGIWMSGTAPAADAAGNIYFIVGNGDFGTTLDANGFPANANCGNCFAKISSSAPLKLLDYFTPLNTVSQSAADIDLGSGGPLLLPDVVDSNGATRHLALGSGKDANIMFSTATTWASSTPAGTTSTNKSAGSSRRRIRKAELFQRYRVLRRGR